MRTCGTASERICAVKIAKRVGTGSEYRFQTGDSADLSRCTAWDERHAGKGGNMGICAGGAVSGSDAAGGVQCVFQGTGDAAGLRHHRRAGNRILQKSAYGGCAYLCGGCCLIDFAVAASGASVRRQTE